MNKVFKLLMNNTPFKLLIPRVKEKGVWFLLHISIDL